MDNNTMTREEMFFNAMINGSEAPKPNTREEMLLKQLADKLNKPAYTYLYQLNNGQGNNKLFLDKELKNPIDFNKLKQLYETENLYYVEVANDGSFSKKGQVIGFSNFTISNGLIWFKIFESTGIHNNKIFHFDM